jgi:hypothetical protein
MKAMDHGMLVVSTQIKGMIDQAQRKMSFEEMKEYYDKHGKFTDKLIIEPKKDNNGLPNNKRPKE